MQIEGKRVLVTGASRGLGLAREILDVIREERYDPPIGDEAKGILDQLSKDALGLERFLANVK